MKHKAFAFWEVIVVLLIIVILAAILFPAFLHGRLSPSPRNDCIRNLKQIGLGFQQYIQDYDDQFPAVAASGGWANAVQPYLKSWRIFHCPSAQSKRDEKIVDYYFNARLSNVEQNKLEDRNLTILAGEGLGGQPMNYSQMKLPDAWRTDEKSPAWRHLEKANYLFVDGHVKSLKPENVTLDKPGKNHPTFMLGKSQ